jgi:hypothetical protein
VFSSDLMGAMGWKTQTQNPPTCWAFCVWDWPCRRRKRFFSSRLRVLYSSSPWNLLGGWRCILYNTVQTSDNREKKIVARIQENGWCFFLFPSKIGRLMELLQMGRKDYIHIKENDS